jgi:hypothetical protein
MNDDLQTIGDERVIDVTYSKMASILQPLKVGKAEKEIHILDTNQD